MNQPQLVEYDKIFNKKISIIPPLPPPPVIKKDNTPLFFNICCILILILGVFLLVKRNEDKDKNQRKYREKINKIYNEIQLN